MIRFWDIFPGQKNLDNTQDFSTPAAAAQLPRQPYKKKAGLIGRLVKVK